MRLCGWMNVKTSETIMTDISIAAEDCVRLAFSGIHIMSDRVFPLMEKYVKDNGISTNSGAGACFPIRDFYLSMARTHPIYGIDDPGLRMLDVGKLDSLDFAQLHNNYYLCRVL